MKTVISIADACFDNTKNFAEAIKKGESMQIHIWPDDDEIRDEEDPYQTIGMWVESTDRNKACTLMMTLSKKDALFLGKSLTAMAKSLK